MSNKLIYQYKLLYMDGQLAGAMARRFGVAATMPMIPLILQYARAIAGIRFHFWQLANPPKDDNIEALSEDKMKQ